MRILTTFLILSFFSSVYANSIKIIRDAEVENFLKEISNILTESTELEKDNLTLFVDNQKYINAFVTPDRKFFFTTQICLLHVICVYLGFSVHARSLINF